MVVATSTGFIHIRDDRGIFSVSSAQNVSSLAYNAKRNRILWVEMNGHYLTIHEMETASKEGGTSLRLLQEFPQSLIGPQLSEYDWVGDNIYLQAASEKIWVCSLKSAECKAVVENFTLTARTGDGATDNHRIGFALDPARG